MVIRLVIGAFLMGLGIWLIADPPFHLITASEEAPDPCRTACDHANSCGHAFAGEQAFSISQEKCQRDRQYRGTRCQHDRI